MDCPLGFQPHLGWSTRCKNCFRSRDDHFQVNSRPSYYSSTVSSTKSQTRSEKDSSGSSRHHVSTWRQEEEFSRTRSTSSRTSSYSTRKKDYDTTSLILVPSALKRTTVEKVTAHTSDITSSYLPPDMHSQYNVGKTADHLFTPTHRRLEASTTKHPSYATLPRTVRDKTSHILPRDSVNATLPRRPVSTPSSTGYGTGDAADLMPNYKRVSLNEKLYSPRKTSTSTHGSASLSATTSPRLNRHTIHTTPTSYRSTYSPITSRRW